MNIFILSKEEFYKTEHFREQARFHCDRHVIKMILESTQMLVTALSSKHYPELGMYLPDTLVNPAYMPCLPLAKGHAKHPCMQWVLQDIKHLNYLAVLAWYLCEEKQHRYPTKPRHKYTTWIERLTMELDSRGFAWTAPLPAHFAVAVKNPALQSTNTPHQEAVAIYRQYYATDKLDFAHWTNRDVPEWFNAIATEQAADGRLFA